MVWYIAAVLKKKTYNVLGGVDLEGGKWGLGGTR